MHCHPERNEVESKDPILNLPQWDSWLSLAMMEETYGSKS
jgi:hypothetical protein